MPDNPIGNIFDPNGPLLKLFSIRQPKRVPLFYNFFQTFNLTGNGVDWPTFQVTFDRQWNFPSRLIRLSVPYVVCRQCTTSPPAVFNFGNCSVVGSAIRYKQQQDDPTFFEINTYQPGTNFIHDLTNNISTFTPGCDFSGMSAAFADNTLMAIGADPSRGNKEQLGYVGRTADVTAFKNTGHTSTGYSYSSMWNEWPVECYGFGFSTIYQPLIESGLQNPNQTLQIVFYCGMWVF